MISTIRSLAYLIASILFILSLRGLSNQESAQRGNRMGVIGMLVAVVITALALLAPVDFASMPTPDWSLVGVLGGALAVGCLIGAVVAARVAMTSMPELVAMLHSFVGAAAVIVGVATYLQPADAYEAGRSAHLVEIYVGVLVGAVTFSGSIIAFGKLRGIIGSRPLLLPGRHVMNLIILTACVTLAYVFVHAEVPWPDAGAEPSDFA